MSNALDRWFLGAVVILAASSLSLRDAFAQSEPLRHGRTSEESPPANEYVALESDTIGVVLYRVFDAERSPLPQRGLVQEGSVLAEPICRLPCAPPLRVLQRDEFFFSGEDVAPSEHFRLTPKLQPRRLRVSSGSRRMYDDGLGLIVFGVFPAAFGLVATPWALSMNGSFSALNVAHDPPTSRGMFDTSPREQYRRELLVAGIASLAVGGVALGLGVPLYRAGRTSYVQYDEKVKAFRF